MAKKPIYYKRLYELRLDDGAQNQDNYMTYLKNVITFNPKNVDIAGGNYHAMISHHVDAATVHMLLTEGFKKGTKGELTVMEVTKTSLEGEHLVYGEMVQNCYLQFDSYPNING